MEVEVVKLGGEEYVVIDEIEKNGNKYVFLSKESDEKDLAIRKIHGDLLVGLDDEEEFDNALELFANKHKDLLND